MTDSSFISAVVQVGLRVPTPHAEEVLSVHLRVLARLQEVALHWLRGPLSARAILAMPDSVTAKRQRNTLSFVFVCVCVCVCVSVRV